MTIHRDTRRAAEPRDLIGLELAFDIGNKGKGARHQGYRRR